MMEQRMKAAKHTLGKIKEPKLERVPIAVKVEDSTTLMLWLTATKF